MNYSAGAAIQKLNSKTETELEDLYSVLQKQSNQISELRSRLGLVICERKGGDCCADGPVAPHLNSPLVDKLKELKAMASQNSVEITSIIDSLEI